MESLFDFDFEPIIISDAEVEEMWNLFRVEMKKTGNYYNEGKIIEKLGLQKYQESFVKKGYMTLKNDRFYADRTKLFYHTIDEILEEFEEKVERFLENPPSDYKGSASWLLDLPCDMAPTIEESQSLKRQIYEAIKPFSKRIAMELGVEYFISNPGGRGTQMNCYKDKAYKKHFLPFFYELVISISDYDEMYKMIHNYSFVVGRRDWFTPIGAPVLEVEKPTLTDLDIAVLCQTTDKKVIDLVLEYCGKCMGGNPKINEDSSGLLFPPTFTYRDYINSLSIDDAAKIIEDTERLALLHGKKVA